MDWVSRCRHWVALKWGGGLDCIRLNSFRIDHIDGCMFVSKRRRWYARFLIPVGNAYLRQIRARTSVLPNHAWRLWECEVYRQAYGSVLLADADNWMQIPQWSGSVLAEYLGSHTPSAAEKLQAIRLAAESLHRLHLLHIRWPDGQQRLFSHGDATVRNVIVTPRLDQATWFDFDMAHEETQHATWRHADDLRAMLFSAAEFFPKELHPDLVQAALTGYADTAVNVVLAASVIQSCDRPNSFHLAQSGLSYDQYRAISTATLTAIGVT